MVVRRKRGVSFLTRLPDSMQSYGVIKLLQQGQDSKYVGRIRWNVCFFGLQRKGRGRSVEIKRERYVLRERAGGIRLPMFIVELAHRPSSFLGFWGGLNGFSNLGANLVSQRMRHAKLLIISASVNGSQNREQCLARIQGHLGRTLGHRD